MHLLQKQIRTTEKQRILHEAYDTQMASLEREATDLIDACAAKL